MTCKRYRVVFHHHGRCDLGRWITKQDAWDIVYHWGVLLPGEWIAVQTKGEPITPFKREAQ